MHWFSNKFSFIRRSSFRVWYLSEKPVDSFVVHTEHTIHTRQNWKTVKTFLGCTQGVAGNVYEILNNWTFGLIHSEYVNAWSTNLLSYQTTSTNVQEPSNHNSALSLRICSLLRSACLHVWMWKKCALDKAEVNLLQVHRLNTTKFADLSCKNTHVFDALLHGVACRRN